MTEYRQLLEEPYHWPGGNVVSSEMTRISAFLGSCDPNYTKQIHTEFMAVSQQANLIKKAVPELQSKIFENDLLTDCMEQNIHKTFVMPIYKELSNIQYFNLWR